MKNFLKQLLIFIIPLMLLGIWAETLLRRIPNNYVLKKEYLDKHSDSLQILFLGSSHAYYGVNPVFINKRSFNAASVSQSLDYDWEILKKYGNRLHSLKYIAIPISAFSLYSKLESGQESFRVKNYLLYYDIHKSRKLSNYAEVFSNNKANIEKLFKYYFLDIDNINSSSLGWGENYNSSIKLDLKVTGELAALRHKRKDNKIFTENKDLLSSFVRYANDRMIKVFFYTPPAYHTYYNNLNKQQLQETLSTIEEITREHQNALYHNYLHDSSFTALDFYDADHLNEIGAKKLTLKIYNMINN